MKNIIETASFVKLSVNSKVPLSIHTNWQNEKCPYEKVRNHKGNIGVATGKISGNLQVLDWDFRSDRKEEGFKIIYEEYKKAFPRLSKTKIVSTPHGFHFYYILKDADYGNTSQKNGGYSTTLKTFIGSSPIKFSKYLKGFDSRGTGGYVVYQGSEVDGKKYEEFNNNELIEIKDEEYEKIFDFFKEKDISKHTIRKAFVDIATGKLNPQKYKQETGLKEHVYWKEFYHEAYSCCGLLPEDLLAGLEKNNKGFDREKTTKQLNNLKNREYILNNKRMSKETYVKYFPDYKKTQINDNKVVDEIFEEKEEKNILNKEQTKFIEDFSNLNGVEIFEMIEKIANFYNCNVENFIMLWITLIENWIDKTIKKNKSSNLIKGETAGGKNWLLDTILFLFNERNYERVSSTTPKGLLYDEKIRNNIVKFLVIPEWHKDSNIEWASIIKSFVDDVGTHKETIRDGSKNITITHQIPAKGTVTTLSFGNIVDDLRNRSYTYTIDQSSKKTERIIDFAEDMEIGITKNSIIKNQISKRCDLISLVYDRLEWDYIVNISGLLQHPIFRKLYPTKMDLSFRRNQIKIFNVIKTITLLNQKNRKTITKNGIKILFAEYEDFYLALKYCQKVFYNIFSNIDDRKIEILKKFN